MKRPGTPRRSEALKRGVAPQRNRKAIAPRSAKTAERDEFYAERRLLFLGAHPRCEIRWEQCSTWATDVHHRAGRSPSVFFDESLWRAACRSCHMAVESQRERAYRQGHLVHRHHRSL